MSTNTSITNSNSSKTPKKLHIMYLKMRHPCPLATMFYLPHKADPVTAKKIASRYPKFAKLFDGQSEENTLSFYYKKNKETDVYEFIDQDAEEEVAELLGVKILEEIVPNDDEVFENNKLTTNQLDEFKDHMQNIRHGIDWLNNQSKNNNSCDSSSDCSSDSSSDSSDCSSDCSNE